METKTNLNVRMGLLVQGRRATSRLRLRLGGGGRAERSGRCVSVRASVGLQSQPWRLCHGVGCASVSAQEVPVPCTPWPWGRPLNDDRFGPGPWARAVPQAPGPGGRGPGAVLPARSNPSHWLQSEKTLPNRSRGKKRKAGNKN